MTLDELAAATAASMTVAEASRALGVTTRRVNAIIAEGELAAFRPTPRKTRVYRASLEAYVDRNNA